jgi:monoamine oxidase
MRDRVSKVQDCDVIVIGAGAAGLAAASYLRRSRKGIRVRVIEARSRLGGRMWTARLWPDRPAVELGAEFIHDSKIGRGIPELERVRGSHVKWGMGRFLLEGQILRGETVGAARDGVSNWIGCYPKENGAISDALARWPRQARLIAAADAEGEYAAAPECVSMNAAYRQWDQWKGGDEEFHTKSGYADLADQLARGVAIECGDPVREVRWARGSVEVTTVSGGRYRARCAISTLPLGVLRRHKVRFTPVLSQAKRDSIRDLGVGRVVKVLVRSDSIPKGVVYVVSDCAVPLWWSSRVGQKGVLVGWAGGRAADALTKIGLESIKRCAAQSIEAIFSGMQSVASRDIHVVDWSKEEFSLGAYSYTPKGCDGDALRSALASPERDTLFFAGEATDLVYFATVTGAMRSGRCAARSVLAIL